MTFGFDGPDGCPAHLRLIRRLAEHGKMTGDALKKTAE